jgi:hypothetical protein
MTQKRICRKNAPEDTKGCGANWMLIKTQYLRSNGAGFKEMENMVLVVWLLKK